MTGAASGSGRATVQAVADVGATGPLESFSHRAADPQEGATVIRFLCLAGSAQINGQAIHTSAAGDQRARY